MTLEQAENISSLLRELHDIQRCKDAFNARFGFTIQFDRPNECFDIPLPPYLIMDFGKEQILGQLNKRAEEIKQEIDKM